MRKPPGTIEKGSNVLLFSSCHQLENLKSAKTSPPEDCEFASIVAVKEYFGNQFGKLIFPPSQLSSVKI